MILLVNIFKERISDIYGKCRPKLTNEAIEQLLNQIDFEQHNLPQGMRARTNYKQTTINIYNSGKVMFQGKQAENIARELLQIITMLPWQQQLQSNHQLIHFNMTNMIVLVAMKPEVEIILVL